MRLMRVGRIRSVHRPAPVRIAAVIVGVAALVCGLRLAHAHPIVSTDINRHVTLTVSDARLEIRYVYEMLEIAAIDAARTWDVDGDGVTAPGERDQFLIAWSAELVRDLRVSMDDAPVPLTIAAARWELGEGAFGLKTWKLTATLRGALPLQRALGALEYRDLLRPQEVGWKEVILVVRGGTTVARADVPAQDRSFELADYAAMSELPNPDVTSASALLRFAAALLPEQPPAAVSADPVQRPGVRSERPSASPEARARPRADESRPARAEGRAATAPSPPPPPVTRRDAVPAPQPSLRAAFAHYAWPFFRLGMHHIATGADHLLFLLGLLLFRQSPARLAAVVTCFTLAHSVTLAVAAAGWITPPGTAVEVLIASSIAYVGAATLVRPGSGHGPWIALVFGLVHGFGFAGALDEALGGITGDRAWLVALASFNLGIEALQLVAVAIAWPLLHYTDRLKYAVALRRIASLFVLGAGITWALQRVG